MKSGADFVDHLRSVALFEDFKENQTALMLFASMMKFKEFSPGDKMIEEGTQSPEMYILLSGQASVYKKTPESETFKVAVLRAEQHAFFGEGGLIGSDVRSATIVADSICQCLILEKKIFQEFGKKHPELALPLYKKIAELVLNRLKRTNSDLLILYKALVAEIRGH